MTMLVVDDNAINRLLLSQMLERLGHTVDMAVDGFAAVDAATRTRYDLILMDINMPGMNGIEATRKIRSHGASVDVPIMGVTANALPQDKVQLAAAGFNTVLIKPITSAALALQVQNLAVPRPAAPAETGAPPLISLESVRDLQTTLRPADFLAITQAALTEARTALSSARKGPSGPVSGDVIHRAAGSVAMIGASRLHAVLCDLENAVRADPPAATATLLDRADRAYQSTDDWFRADALS